MKLLITLMIVFGVSPSWSQTLIAPEKCVKEIHFNSANVSEFEGRLSAQLRIIRGSWRTRPLVASIYCNYNGDTVGSGMTGKRFNVLLEAKDDAAMNLTNEDLEKGYVFENFGKCFQAVKLIQRDFPTSMGEAGPYTGTIKLGCGADKKVLEVNIHQ